MALEDLLEHVNDRGRCQILASLILIFLTMVSVFNDYLENFTAAIPDHHCYVNLLDNPRSEANITINLTTEALLRVSIPLGPDQKPEPCRRFRETQWQLLDAGAHAINNTELETEPCLDGWTYDHSVFTSTIVSEWDLVCDYQSFKYFAQTISMAGILVGAAIWGIVSDRVGRKPLLAFCCLAYGVLGTCCAFAPVFSLYYMLRFLSSVFISAIHTNTVILLLEGSSLTWHPTLVIAFGASMSVGQALLGGLAYVFRDWHMLLLAASLPHFLFSLFLCWVPESVSWLMTTGKLDRALKELQRIAYINGKKDTAQSLTIEILESKLKDDLSVTREPIRIKEIIVNSSLRKMVLCLSILLFSALFSLYGLMLDIRILGKNIYLTQFLLGFIDVPIKFLSLFVIRRVSRRPSMAFSIILYGISMLVTIFVSEEMHVLRLIIFLLGKGSFSIFAAVSTAVVNESSPTVLRSTISSVVYLAARIAVILSALVLISRRYFESLPMILFGTIPIVASISIYFLPETFNLPIPNTIKDVEKRDSFRNKSIRKKETKDLLETTEV